MSMIWNRVFVSCALIVAMIASSNVHAQGVDAGTTIPVTVVGAVSSETAGGMANPNSFIVASDVRDRNGKVSIKAGTPVQALIKAQPRKRVGRAGYVDVTLIGTSNAAGQTVRLTSATYHFEGKKKRGTALGVGLGVGLFWWPVMFTMMMKGGEATVPAGQVLSATVLP